MSEPVFVPVDPRLRDRVLAPYLEGCDYVKEASWHRGRAGEGPILRARLAIARSCYIQETGHFNAVEANIAFNQMFYLLAAQGVVAGVLPGFVGMDLEEWLARQLPHVLIKDYEFHFLGVIDRGSFEGEMRLATVEPKTRFVVFDAHARFFDAAGGEAKGRSTLFFDNRHLEEQKADAHG